MNLGTRGSSRFVTAAIGFSMAVMLNACGGGGGGSTSPTPVSQTVTCPNGTSKTGTGTTASVALDAATAQCAAPVLTTVTPSNGATGIAPDTFASLVVATDSTLDPASLTTATVTLKAGQTAVTGAVTADGTKGFKFTPSAKLMHAQVYSFVATVKDTLGKSLAVNSTFTTASVSCAAPLVPNAAGTTCVPPTCALPAVWDGSACTVPVLHYTDKVFAIWTGGQIYAVTKTSVTLVTNKTQYTTGSYPLWGCWMAPPSVSILADGEILHACQDAVTLRRHYLALNPITGEQNEYAGPVTATLQCTENADKTWSCPVNTDWVAVQGSAPAGAPANDGTATQVSDGWYFTTGGTRSTLKFKTTATGMESVVKAGDAFVDGNIRVLLTFGN